MNRSRVILSFISTVWIGLGLGGSEFFFANPLFAQSSPILQLRPDGPLAPIHAFEFSADGKTLYAAGDEKLVQVWARTGNQPFVRSHAKSRRQRIGPGPLGTIHTMSLSHPDRYLVTGGVGTFEQHAGFSENGIMIPPFGWSRQTLDEIGSVTLHDLEKDESVLIKTHPGYVLATQLVSIDDAGTYLVTIGNDQDATDCKVLAKTPLKRSLRVFDVPSGKLRFKWDIPATAIAPQLLAWSMENARSIEGLRIAVSFASGNSGDGIDLFTPGNETPIRIAEPLGLAFDRLGDPDRLCVASNRSLAIYRTSDASLQRRIHLSQLLQPSEYIFSLRTIAGQPGSVAITTRNLAIADSPHRLRLVSLETGNALLQSPIDLGRRQNPQLAVDQRGTILAATADVTEGIQLFDLSRLKKGDPQPLQVLKPEFEPIIDATLVIDKNEKLLQFKLVERPTPQTRGPGFPPGTTSPPGEKPGLRSEESELKTYQLADNALQEVNATNWEDFDVPLAFFRKENTNQYVAKVTVGGNPFGEIHIASSMPPVAKILRSKVLDGKPLAAVGYLQNANEAQSTLSLFDPETGNELRRLSGHHQTITSLRFSEDHQHLTSVSADGMVCVWYLGDLVDLIGKRSAIRSVKWCCDGESIVVSEMDENAASSKLKPSQLKPGDVLLGMVGQDGSLQPYSDPEEFFQAISFLKPGDDVKLRVERNQQQIDVAEELGQATDERKPLFSFISSRRDRVGDLAWLAWTPSGPFQSSGPEIEAKAGWHFNPETPEDSVRFAPFAQYRDQFSGDSLVDELLANNRIPDVWPPFVDISMVARVIDAAGNTVDAEGDLYEVLQQPDQILVSVPGAPANSIRKVTVSLDEHPAVSLSRSEQDAQIWTGKIQGELQPNFYSSLYVTAHSDRLPDGLKRQSWVVSLAASEPVDVDVDAPGIDELRPPEREFTPRKLRLTALNPLAPSDADPETDQQWFELEASVDADEIEPLSKFSGLRNRDAVDLEDVTVNGNRVTARVRLPLGESIVALQMNSGDQVIESPVVQVKVKDPPTIESLTSGINDQNQGSISLLVKSNQGLDKSNIRLRVNGIITTNWDFESAANAEGENEWLVVVDSLPLSVGVNRIDLELRDDENEVCQRKSLSLVAMPLPEQPKIILSLANGATFDSPTISIAANIECADLDQVRCRINDNEIPVELPSSPESKTHLTIIEIPLTLGVNRISVTAEAKSGLTDRVTRMVSRIERPVELVAERFVGSEASAVELQLSERNSFSASAASTTATGTIEGYVRLPSSSDIDKETPKTVRAWVNGFLQSVVKLDVSEDADVLRFQIPVLLSLEENHVFLDLPGLVEDESSLAHVTLDCNNPSKDQTLHLLMVSTRVPWTKRKEFEKQVLNLLRVEDEKMPAFNRVISGAPVYPALTGDICRSDNVRQLIQQCRFELAGTQASNNTVLLFFHGEELRSADGQLCLMTRDARPDRAFTDSNLITSRYLGEQLEGIRCANLIFLDVTEHIESASVATAGDPSQPSLGILRMVRDAKVGNLDSPMLLDQVRRVIPEVGELGQLTRALQSEQLRRTGVVINDSIPMAIERMRINE
ncbi:WD domain, G-beta repeat [Novipirellula aureliae]|uniref:WD domain, G-beta repeat n=1 Tax=Novipirellula aureliae TaxID=2527966 RepID=A0A5C6DWQ8_9BACT|nr:hypothetical protein [Novipirellula aureliae]TWU40327.1 WD domain, G-beta repeat [Novipirellula aureliae]